MLSEKAKGNLIAVAFLAFLGQATVRIGLDWKHESDQKARAKDWPRRFDQLKVGDSWDRVREVMGEATNGCELRQVSSDLPVIGHVVVYDDGQSDFRFTFLKKDGDHVASLERTNRSDPAWRPCTGH